MNLDFRIANVELKNKIFTCAEIVNLTSNIVN